MKTNRANQRYNADIRGFKGKYITIALSMGMLILILFSTPSGALSSVSVPWNFEVYTGMAIGEYDNGVSNSDIDFDLSFGMNKASVLAHNEFYTQVGGGSSDIGSLMNDEKSISLSSTAVNNLFSPDSYSSGKGVAVFAGGFTATQPLYSFSYDYDYLISATASSPGASAYNTVKGWLSVYDSNSNTLLMDELFLFDKVSGTMTNGNFGSGILSTPITMGNDITVLLALSDESVARGISHAGSNTLDLNYKMTLAPEPVSSALFIAGGVVLGCRRLMMRRPKK